jgi:hypothetical protein
MACPNFKKGMKMAFGPLGVKQIGVALERGCGCLVRPVILSLFL